MLLFGLTGGIASGKSVVAKLLSQKGLDMIDADSLAKELTNTLPEIQQELRNLFGEDIFTEHGSLDASELGKIVFFDSMAREQVNAIIHPHVFAHVTKQAGAHFKKGKKIVGVEAALIFEARMNEILQRVVVVHAPLDKRIAWLMQRNNLSQEEALARINSQMPAEEKVKRADYVVNNDGTLTDLQLKVDSLHTWLSSQLN